MPGIRLATLVRRLRRDTAADGAGVSDAELLARFVRTRDDAAFELLVWRHGAMVLAACRRVLGNPEDAEDAFQAVFLVLARKAASVARGAALPAWLHRVALRLSLRHARSRRPAAELVADPPAAAVADATEQNDLRGVLDAEIDHLPEHCRRAVVLCYLEGLSGSEAARLLGCPTGTVESRLAAARKRLRDRLTRRGVTLPVGILAVVASPAGLAAEVVTRTARAGVAVARQGMRAAAGLVRDPAVKLAKGALVMASVRAWSGLVLGVAVVAVAAGVGWANRPTDGEPNAVAAVPEAAPPPTAKADPKPPADAWPLARQLRGLAPARLVCITAVGGSPVITDSRMVWAIKLSSASGPQSQTTTFAFSSPNTISDVAVSPDMKLAATAEGSNGVKLREIASRTVIEALWPSGSLPAVQVAFTPDGTKLVALCARTEQTEVKTGKKNPSGGKNLEPGRMAPARAVTRFVKQVQVSVWDVASRKELGHKVETTTVEMERLLPTYALTENGRFVLKTEIVRPMPPDEDAAPMPGGVRFTLIDAVTGKAAKTIDQTGPNFAGRGFTATPAPDGKTFAVLDTAVRREVELIDVATGTKRAALGPLRRPIHTLAYSPDGRLIAAATGTESRSSPRASSGGDGIAAPTEVVIWETATGKEVARLVDKESNRDYTAVRFSPDGSFLVAQDESRAMTIWGRPPALESEADAAPPSKGKGKSKGKATEPPAPAPAAGVPDRFAALFRELSAEGVADVRRVESVFLAALGRLPTDVESRTLASQLAKRTDKTEALKDLLATLVETAEFKAHAEALGRLAK